MNPSSTQQFIEIAGIKDGIIILRNGSYRIILSISAVNFSLKSEQEQNSIIFQYQSFLNSLHFPIQVVIQSKKLDLNAYMKKVSTIKDSQKNELLKLQTEDYIDFVNQLINIANIMKKSFFVVVGYDPVNIKSTSFLDKLFFKGNTQGNLRVSETDFKRYKEELMERANIVASGLGSMGLHCVQLTTEENIELFYKIYNPEVADKEKFEDVEQLTSPVIAGKSEKVESEKPGQKKEEILIDNSALVEEQRKQEYQMKEMEAQKDAEKQSAAPQKPLEEKVKPTTSSAPVPPPAAQPQAMPANTNTAPAAAPANQTVPLQEYTTTNRNINTNGPTNPPTTSSNDAGSNAA